MRHRWTRALRVAAALSAAFATVAPGQTTATSRTRVLMLGTGNPNPAPERFGPATAVIVDSTAYLVDAGVGVMRRWSAARARGLVDGVRWRRVAFITHLHSDHTLGYPELILSLWEGLERAAQGPPNEGQLAHNQGPDLIVYGPKGLKAMTAHILAAWSEDIAIRSGARGELAGRSPPQVMVHEIEPGVVYHDSLVTVTAFHVHHGTWPQAYGYRFNTPDRVVVLSGDAAPPSAIPEQCRQCDILVHEGGLPQDLATPYYLEFHSTAEEVARVADQSHPRLLVLSHQRPGINVRGLAIIRALYAGKVVIANDLDVY